MDVIEYQNLAKRTLVDLGSKNKNITHMELGIATEFGELLDIFKKKIAYGKDIDRVNLSEELADICWYCVNAYTLLNQELDEDDFSSRLRDMKILSEEEYINTLDVPYYISLQSASFDDFEYVDILEEVYYIAAVFKIDMRKSLENNIAKLRVRFPEKFDSNLAINRNVNEERKELEKN